MYVGIDIGATKTLLGRFDDDGQLLDTFKFDTSEDQSVFLENLAHNLGAYIRNKKIKAFAVAAPGLVNKTTLVHGGRLPWQNVDFKAALGHFGIPIAVENDAVLGGLAEARSGAGKDFQVVLYITISTGVGTGIIVNKQIFPHSSEGGYMLSDNNNLTTIQDTLSGPSFKARFGKFGNEIDDLEVWEEYSKDLALGMFNMITLICPDVVVLGGGMSVHFDKFIKPLKDKLTKLIADIPVIILPAVKQAARPETAVLYGCYELAKELA